MVPQLSSKSVVTPKQMNKNKANSNPVRCSHNSSAGGTPFLTGVGSYVPPEIPREDCVAPSHPPSCWDDGDEDGSYEFTDSDRFPPLLGNWARPQPEFPVREVCWEVLQGMAYP